MSEQEMIDAAVAAYESGQWGEWLAWIAERNIVELVVVPTCNNVVTYSASAGITNEASTTTSNAYHHFEFVGVRIGAR